MRLQILAIGRMKKGPETALLDHYVDRLSKAARGLGVSSVEQFTPPESRAGTTEQRKTEEAEKLLSKVDPSDHLIVLDEHGKDMDSVMFSQQLRGALDGGNACLSIAIGGPDGHGQAVLDRANTILRFGKMTWPHQLVRVLAAEQLYRAATILNGHPYHRV